MNNPDLLFQHPTNRGVFATRAEFDGVSRFFVLGPYEDRARLLAVALQRMSRACDPFEQVEEWLGGELARPFAPSSGRIATIGEIAKSYMKHAKDLGIDPLTAQRNQLGLLRVIETVVLHEQGVVREKKRAPDKGGSLGPEHYPAAAPVSASRLNASLAKLFEAAKLRDVSFDDPRYDGVCATIRSDLARAKSMFTEAAMAAYTGDQLIIPNLLPFLYAETFPARNSQFRAPGSKRIRAAFQAVLQLRDDDVDGHRIASLALESGATPKEIVSAQTTHLGPPGTPTLKVRVGTKWERTLLLSATLHQDLRTLPVGYIIPGNERQRSDKCCETTQRLRRGDRGAAFSPLAEYRDYFGHFLASRLTPVLLHQRLGNRYKETTVRFLEVDPMPDDLAALWPPDLARALPNPA